jgi:hypothetical protein
LHYGHFQGILKMMTFDQEEALYDFLDKSSQAFSLEDIFKELRGAGNKRNFRLKEEIALYLDSRRAAFKIDQDHWVSGKGFFEGIPFVISPTRSELLNGILIPGHRCIPFANTELYPHEYSFFWKGEPVPFTTSEGPPEDFYPFYCIFGEEYAPQYVARDNAENEEAYNADPFEEPPEVSIRTLDMRNIYRESAFVPGDRFIVKTLDWKQGRFELEKTGKDQWDEADLESWRLAAEGGFYESFAKLGPGATTYEQIAYAYWYGEARMRELPAWSLEEFIYEKTERIDTAAYGIETRFWYAGKEIPDSKSLDLSQIPPERTPIEDLLIRKKIPVSIYVLNSFIRDALFRGEDDISRIVERVIPSIIQLEEMEWNAIAFYIVDVMEELRETYSCFKDRAMGAIRQRVCELHSAVIELSAKLNTEIGAEWLPRHTFIILSQIQTHAAGLLEDLDTDEAPPQPELEAIDNSLDNMIETYEDIKEMIDEDLNVFRHNNFSLVKPESSRQGAWKSVQISIGGTEVWRRVLAPASLCLEELHLIVQAALNWKNTLTWRCVIEKGGGIPLRFIDKHIRIEELIDEGSTELLFEYGLNWIVKIIFFPYDTAGFDGSILCKAGEWAAPPEQIEGPVRYKKLLYFLENGSEQELRQARSLLGENFAPEFFDIPACNRRLSELMLNQPLRQDSSKPIKLV